MIYKLLFISITFLSLILLSYTIINFKKIKYSFNILIGILNIWCVMTYLYIIIQTDYNGLFTLIITIFSVIFHFGYALPKVKTIEVFSIGIVWLSTLLSCLLCFSGMGAIMIILIQPISYLFGSYLLKIKNKNINIPLYINLIITWGFFFLTSAWVLTH